MFIYLPIYLIDHILYSMILSIFVFTYVTDIKSSIKRKNNTNVVKYEWASYILYMFKNNIKNCGLTLFLIFVHHNDKDKIVLYVNQKCEKCNTINDIV